ncbi:MAG TPA: NUDIX domain-containing protein [Sphingobacteriaceae bacterium]|nr:NUDIX domain-containing protein [Sphingobacteriaceae bacterium]
MMYPFNVRVYGLLINDKRQILLSDEEEHGMRFIKFPGGGLEFGEGLLDGLKREFSEECNVEIEVLEHFYTTDFFVKSAFDDSQVISIYYYVKPKTELLLNFKKLLFDFDSQAELLQAFRWKSIDELDENDVTFPADKRVVALLKRTWIANS